METSAATVPGWAPATRMAIPAPLEKPVTTTRRGSTSPAVTSWRTRATKNASSSGPAAPRRPSLNAGPSLSGRASTSPAARAEATSPVRPAKVAAVCRRPWNATTRAARPVADGVDSTKARRMPATCTVHRVVAAGRGVGWSRPQRGDHVDVAVASATAAGAVDASAEAAVARIRVPPRVAATTRRTRPSTPAERTSGRGRPPRRLGRVRMALRITATAGSHRASTTRIPTRP